MSRQGGRFGFFALAFGSMIGVGWVTALGGWLEKAGPLGAIQAFLVGTVLMLAMVIPGSPAALAWPGEAIILAVFAILGGWFWLGGTHDRGLVSDSTRAYLILEEGVESHQSPTSRA